VSTDPQPRPRRGGPTVSYDNTPRISYLGPIWGDLDPAAGEQPETEPPAPPPPPWRVDRDADRDVLRVTAPDGQTECFRAQAARFLVVEVDPQTGAVTPEICGGRPTILSPCRSVRP
jgi:hypothetical protein